MNKKISLIIVGLVIASVVLVGTYFIVKANTPKMGYVELEKIYNDFPMKKELESKLTNVQQARKSILDSLKIQLNALSLSIKSEKDVDAIRNFQIKKQEYMLKQKNFDEDNQSTTKSYSGQIWKQINQYVKDYGNKNDYTMIIGADGSGNLLYGADAKNITTVVSTYINDRFKGEDK